MFVLGETKQLALTGPITVVVVHTVDDQGHADEAKNSVERALGSQTASARAPRVPAQPSVCLKEQRTLRIISQASVK